MTVSTVQEKTYQNTARNLYLNKEFIALTDLFRTHDISFIPLKGIALIQEMYPHIGARYIGDIDILIKCEHVQKALGALKEQGYSIHVPFHFDQKKPYSVYLNSVPLSKQTKIHYAIHLHWHILNTTLPLFMYSIDMQNIWQEACREHIEGREVLTMAAHHALLYLSLHAFHHSYQKKNLLEDIKNLAIFYKSSLDWHKVTRDAHKWNIALPAYYSLYFASELTQLDVPLEVLQELTPKNVTYSQKKLIHSILKNGQGAHNFVYNLYLDMCSSVFNKCKFIFLSFFPSYSVLARVYRIKYKPFIVFYYAKRLFWGIYQALCTCKRLVFKKS